MSRSIQRRWRTRLGGPHDQFDLIDAIELALPVSLEPVEVMLLDPGLQETGRDRHAGPGAVAIHEMHACEPAHVGFFAEFGAQFLADALPARLTR